jgi:hypothetical protein
VSHNTQFAERKIVESNPLVHLFYLSLSKSDKWAFVAVRVVKTKNFPGMGQSFRVNRLAVQEPDRFGLAVVLNDVLSMNNKRNKTCLRRIQLHKLKHYINR